MIWVWCTATHCPTFFFSSPCCRDQSCAACHCKNWTQTPNWSPWIWTLWCHSHQRLSLCTHLLARNQHLLSSPQSPQCWHLRLQQTAGNHWCKQPFCPSPGYSLWRFFWIWKKRMPFEVTSHWTEQESICVHVCFCHKKITRGCHLPTGREGSAPLIERQMTMLKSLEPALGLMMFTKNQFAKPQPTKSQLTQSVTTATISRKRWIFGKHRILNTVRKACES